MFFKRKSEKISLLRYTHISKLATLIIKQEMLATVTFLIGRGLYLNRNEKSEVSKWYDVSKVDSE